MISVNRTKRGVTISGLELGQKLRVQFPSTPQSKTYTASEQGIILVKELVDGVLPSKIEISSVVYIPRGELDTLDFKGTPPKCFIYKGAIAVSGLEPGRNYEIHFPIPLEKQYVANSKGRVRINSSKNNFLSDESVINVEDGGENRSYELGQVSSDNVVKPSDSAYKIGLVSRKDSFGFQAKKVEKFTATSGEIKPKYYTLGLKEITNYKGEKETVYAPVEIEWQDEWGWNWDDIDGPYGRVHNGEILKDDVETPEEIEADEDAIAVPYGIGGSAWINGATMRLMSLGKTSINKSELGGKKFFDYEESFPWENPEFSQEEIEQMNQRETKFSNYFNARCKNFDDTAIDGSRCGHRSASSRSGGK